ncbi:hypothetical protein AB0E27_01940 [Streptomyces sparsogenes]|uniref:hypothetical protein n=1 Tax=Streptomyces sparsogenes TaxID=67365 RepID=UPI0034039D1F
MRTTKKSTLAGVVGLTTTAAATLILAIPGSAGATPVPIDPVERYELYLKDKEASGDTEAAEVLNKFQDFPEEKQEAFVEYINDPEVNKAFAEALSSDNGDPEGTGDEENYPAEQRKELYGGDVVIESEYHSEPLGDTGSRSTIGAGTQGIAADWRAWHSVADTVFGVKVTKVTVGVNYRTSTSRTTKVYSGWAGQSNFVPGVSFENDPVKKWISADPANNAHAETVWKGKLAGGVYTWSCRHRVWADQDGYKGGYLKRI